MEWTCRLSSLRCSTRQRRADEADRVSEACSPRGRLRLRRGPIRCVSDRRTWGVATVSILQVLLRPRQHEGWMSCPSWYVRVSRRRIVGTPATWRTHHGNHPPLKCHWVVSFMPKGSILAPMACTSSDAIHRGTKERKDRLADQMPVSPSHSFLTRRSSQNIPVIPCA